MNTYNALQLYATQQAPPPQPSVRFSRTLTNIWPHPVAYRNSDLSNDRTGNHNLMTNYGVDCGHYARSLMKSNMPNWAKMGFKEELVAHTHTPQVGKAYYIKFNHRGGQRLQRRQRVLAPWDVTREVEKGLTNFHVATVVARDGGSAITSEVNAAYQQATVPWFQMYSGGLPSFYEKFRAEYVSLHGNQRLNPELYEYKLNVN
ncbi:hypothetical protein [Spartinivicinus poritis]|uniref:Uncharacterized protein n=1 Tax=Spartinivicinus poritis TaxID=2994640 RepID=A0ABT5UHE1_9GAMM|nr:hypothetical protein [Spartinivicinus sp. A2-2]MDE1465817.1 hypothetical protein [Spartinivicinus sp. A2-2]